MSVLSAGNYSGGEGTEANPYQIANLNDLSKLCQTKTHWNKHFIQTADIDASATQYWDDSDDDNDDDLYNDDDDATSEGNNDGFSPIGPDHLTYFSGSYDGNGHIIDGLFINRVQNYIGLFGILWGSETDYVLVKDLGLLNANITGHTYVGTLAGRAGWYADIENCYATGTVVGTSNSGGLLGWLLYGNLNTCFANVSVKATGYVGGLIGSIQGSVVSNSYCLGSVIKNNEFSSYLTWLGGFIGSTYESSTVTNCYSTGLIGTANITGGFMGAIDASTSSSSACFWDKGTSGITSSAAGTDKTTAEMKTQSTFIGAGWDFTNESDNGIWNISSTKNDGYPYLENNQESESATPITLTSFSALENNGSIDLTWETATETDNVCFNIYRNNEAIASINGAGTSSEPHNYSYRDATVIPGITYTYILADMSYGNVETRYSNNAVSLMISSDNIEANFVMNAAYPNPFNPSTLISYQLSKLSKVELNIYDAKGVLIDQLIKGFVEPGYHELNWNASSKPSGVYIVSMQAAGLTHNQKIVLMK